MTAEESASAAGSKRVLGSSVLGWAPVCCSGLPGPARPPGQRREPVRCSGPASAPVMLERRMAPALADCQPALAPATPERPATPPALEEPSMAEASASVRGLRSVRAWREQGRLGRSGWGPAWSRAQEPAARTERRSRWPTPSSARRSLSPASSRDRRPLLLVRSPAWRRQSPCPAARHRRGPKATPPWRRRARAPVPGSRYAIAAPCCAAPYAQTRYLLTVYTSVARRWITEQGKKPTGGYVRPAVRPRHRRWRPTVP